jgi:hypothetical protein
MTGPVFEYQFRVGIWPKSATAQGADRQMSYVTGIAAIDGASGLTAV